MTYYRYPRPPRPRLLTALGEAAVLLFVLVSLVLLFGSLE